MMRSAIVLFVLAGCLVSHSLVASEMEPKNEPRLLSKISVPMGRSCNSDVSGDGKILYTMCDSTLGESHKIQAYDLRIYIYDISDLHNPKKLSETPLGQAQGMRLVVRSNIAFYQEIPNQSISIIDVRDLLHPKRAGHIDTGSSLAFKVSDDGQVVAVKLPTDEKIFFDVSDPYSPRESTLDLHISEEIASSPGKWSSFESGYVDGINGEIDFVDLRDRKVLITTHKTFPVLQLYDVSTRGKPVLLSSLIEPASSFFAAIIPGTQAVLFGGKEDSQFVITLSSAVQTSFDLDALKTSYKLLASKYTNCADENIYSSECSEIGMYGLAELADAGIEKLVHEQPDGLTEKERILMLNDYGFWLYRWKQKDEESLKKSSDVLSKVIELDPNRSAAWLNLGDTLKALVPLAITETEKAQLWSKSSRAYEQYHELSGKNASQSKEMTDFDLPAIINSAEDVCDYVATAYNHAEQRNISSPRGTAKAGEVSVDFTVGWEGGSCSWPAIKAVGHEATFDPHPNKEVDMFRFASQSYGAGGAGVIIVPFRGSYYTVSVDNQGPQQLMDPNSGPICNFIRSYNAKLAENKNPELCSKYLAGTLEHNIEWKPLSENEIEPGRTNFARADANFDRNAIVKLDSNEKNSGQPPFLSPGFNSVS